MIPTYFLRNALKVAAAAALASFGVMDCNPSLFCYHQLLESRSSLKVKAYSKHFANKTVWVVGASSGIGEALACELSLYCKTLILSSRKVGALQKVALRCQENQSRTSSRANSAQYPGGNVIILPFDVTSSPDLLEKMITEELMPHLQSPPRLDCVLFNAGQGHLSTVQETDPATTWQMFRVNAIPPIILTQFLLKHKLLAPHPPNSDKPQLVLTCSVGGRMGVPLSSSYAASKHALHGYVASLQSECSSWLRVDTLCPGPIDTNFFQNQQSFCIEKRDNRPDNDNSHNNKNRVGADGEKMITTKKSPLKMPVKRCAALAMSHMTRGGNGKEAWIAQQPTLLAMYLQQYFPGMWNYALHQKVGPKRVSLYQQGLDLYDPASWAGGTKTFKENGSQ